MNWNAILTELLKAIIGIAVPIIAVFLCKAIKKLSDYLREKTENEKTKAILEEVEKAVTTAVAYVSQTMVIDLKEKGQFDAEKAKLAFRKAYNTVIATVSDKAIDYLTMTFGTPETYITAKIEEEVDYHNTFKAFRTEPKEEAKEETKEEVEG